MPRDVEKTVGNLIDHQKVSYIGSVDEEGYPNIKAFNAPRKREGVKTIYFSTNTSSHHVAQFRAEPKACLYFCDRRFFRGVLLRGVMEVLEDVESKEMLWQTGDTMYYHGGVTDQDYCVLRFTAVDGRMYGGFKSEDFTIE
ncbi:putative stress protein (General stress protein 26) [uncultured Eubacteriales bacterium]|uniref:Putative stress protein (General stress protein 26) n=1 Tax=uncultured Eubacteriales bacterium TaxID=172733 RepID=A0A212JUV8_9FIRM|nr:putative stress protein (General stress protein 26) [uncultured Eubacteriales bacterium]